MTDTITVTGVIATPPNHLVTSAGLPITSFRLASTQRRYDRAQQKWVDGDTNWYTVTCFRQLANNVIGSVDRGQRIIVTGRLRLRDWKTEEKAGTNVEIDADAIGHDLSWGTAVFTRSVSSTVSQEADQASEPALTLGDVGDEPSSSIESAEASAAAQASTAVEVAVPF